MSVKATISIIFDIIPIVGGIKMIREAKKKKTFEGDVLEGRYRLIHGGMGILSLVLDIVTVGVGGALEKGAYATIRKTLMKEAMEKASQSALKTGAKTATKTGESSVVRDQLKKQVRQYRQGNNRGYKKQESSKEEEQEQY